MAKRKHRRHPTERSDSVLSPGGNRQDSVDQEADSAIQRFPFGAQLLGACAVALLLRLLHVMQTFQVPTVVELLGDAKGYFHWAAEISGVPFPANPALPAKPGNWLGSETFYQAPLYPYFLAVLFKLMGPSITGVRLMQSLLGVVSVALIGLSGRKMFTPRVGILAAAMLAVYPPAIYYDGIIQKASLSSVLLCGLLAACVYLQLERRVWMSLLAGCLLGLLVITRENALLWVPLVPVWILLAVKEAPSIEQVQSIKPTPSKRRWILAAACAAGIALVLFPVAARNAMLGGEWSPTTFQAGPNFYIGNNLNANGIYLPLVPGHETPMYERADAQRLAEQAEGRELSPREVSKFWMKRAWEEIRQSKGRWMQLMIAKTFMVFNRFEVPDVESMYLFREYSAVLRIMRWWHFGFLCPLGIWGLIATQKDWRQLWLHHVLITTMIAAIVLFFILGRYRQPIAILLIPFAAAGVADLWHRLRARQMKPIAIAAGTLLISGVICNLRVHDERSLNASCYMNLGISAAKANNMQTSIQFFQRAIDEFPELSEAHFNLGRALVITGQPQRAVASFQRAQRLTPDLPGVDFWLARSLEQIGQFEAAAFHYQRALQMDPSDQRAVQALQRLSRG